MKLLLFYKDSCSQCKQQKKILEEFQSVRYIDFDKFPELAKKYKVKETPSTVLCDEDDTMLRKISGFASKNVINTVLRTEKLTNRWIK